MIRYSFIPFLVLVLYCSDKSFNNACDINSESYLNSVILFNLIGEGKSNCSTGMIDLNPSVVTLNPKKGIVSESGGNLNVGSSITFVARLKKMPGSKVDIQLVISNPNYATVTPIILTFDPNNWSTPQNFMVTAINDNLINGNRKFTVLVIPKSEDTSLDLTQTEIQMDIIDNEKRLFISTNPFLGGSFGGISGADTICSTDIKCPAGSVCKAMILGTTRIASQNADLGDGQIDWVLHPNTHYYLTNNVTLIANTNSTSLLQIPFNNIVDGVAPGTWLGSNSGWVLGGNSCLNWTDITAGITGYMFRTQFTNSTLFGGNYSCSNPVNLFCVEY